MKKYRGMTPKEYEEFLKDTFYSVVIFIGMLLTFIIIAVIEIEG